MVTERAAVAKVVTERAAVAKVVAKFESSGKFEVSYISSTALRKARTAPRFAPIWGVRSKIDTLGGG